MRSEEYERVLMEMLRKEVSIRIAAGDADAMLRELDTPEAAELSGLLADGATVDEAMRFVATRTVEPTPLFLALAGSVAEDIGTVRLIEVFAATHDA